MGTTVKHLLSVAAICVAAALSSTSRGPLRAQTPDPIALTGVVSSAEEGPMEGVLVSARRTGSTITVTVVSDRQGRYRFPASRLEPGQYALRVRAAGYEVDSPSADVAAHKTSTADLTLQKA